MDFTALFAVVALVAFATVLGLVWRARTGRVVPVRSVAGGAPTVDLPEVPRDGMATLLQFSTSVCAPCVPTRALLSTIAKEHSNVRHIDLDLTNRPDLASEFSILQTPTTLILDREGVIRARIGGAPRKAAVDAEIAKLSSFTPDRSEH